MVMSSNCGASLLQTCYRAQGCVAVLERWVRGDLAEPKALIVKTITELDMAISGLISDG